MTDVAIPREAALRYAARGWPVIPLHTIRNGECSCGVGGCKSSGKHPIAALAPHGLKDASVEAAVIRDWWRRWPEANVGVLTGHASGLIALDVDPRNGGLASLARLIERHGAPPETLTSYTGGGGMHYLYRHPGVHVKSAANALGADLPGLDIKGDGGYIVASPSLHSSGSRYAWEDETTPIAAMPTFLARAPLSPQGEGLGVRLPHHRINEGERNSSLTSFAGALRAQGMEQEEITAALLARNAERCDPPLDEREVREIAESVSRYPPNPQRKESAAARLVSLCGEADLFHTPDGEPFATITIQGHRETWPLRARAFKRWLTHAYYRACDAVPNSQAVQDALAALEGRALHDGPQRAVNLRVADLNGVLYLDLVNDAWQTVEITTTGWRVIDDAPVRFRRTCGMLALPTPIHGGRVDELRAFVNVAGDSDWRLMVGWLIAALRPRGPYPLLVLQGEQGTAKSTTARALRALVDPSKAPLRALPRDERDLMIAASNSWALAFDNLSGLSPWMADALCRIATGGGFATRELFSDADEILFDAMRPMILNGIDEIATRQDLADRALVLTLPQITDTRRRSEQAFWRDFADAAPRVLGALLDALSVGLRNEASVTLPTLPRMADFALWVTAAEPGLRWPEGSFIAAYAGNQVDTVEASIEGDQLASAVLALVEREREWSGIATDLLARLEADTDERARRSRSWPKTPRVLSNRLRRVSTFLRRVGVEIEYRREQKRRMITLRQCAQPSVTSVTSVTAANQVAESSDAVEQSEAPQTASPMTQLDPLGSAASSSMSVSAPARDAGDAHDADLRAPSDRTPFLLDTRPDPLTHRPLLQARVDQLIAQGIREDHAIRAALIERGALSEECGGAAIEIS